MDCLIDGDAKSLGRCVKHLTDTSMWDVAAQDLQKVHPDQVRLVLKKFGVKARKLVDANGIVYKELESYNSWFNKIMTHKDLSKEVKDAIKNNDHLRTYIRGLITICRASPQIINKNVQSIKVREETMSNLQKALNLRKYRIPNGGQQYKFFAETMRNINYPTDVSNTLYNPIISGFMSNVIPVSPATTMVPTLYGGATSYIISPGLSETGDLSKMKTVGSAKRADYFSNIFMMLNNSLKNVGVEIHKDDREKIYTAIKNIAKLENQLGQISMLLITFVNLSRFMGVQISDIDSVNPKTVTLESLNDKIQDPNNLRNFLIGHIKNLKGSMTNNMNLSQSLQNDLNKAYPRLADNCIDMGSKTESESVADESMYVELTD
jgi:hypothetical protein